jgi:hypothetical protein
MTTITHCSETSTAKKTKNNISAAPAFADVCNCYCQFLQKVIPAVLTDITETSGLAEIDRQIS